MYKSIEADTRGASGKGWIEGAAGDGQWDQVSSLGL